MVGAGVGGAASGVVSSLRVRYRCGIGLPEGRFCTTDSARTLLTRATVLFERTTEVDPNWALAWAALAESRHWLASSSYMGTRQADSLYRLGKQAAERAISLDANEPSAHAALGFVLARWEWNWEGSERAFTEAQRHVHADYRHASDLIPDPYVQVGDDRRPTDHGAGEAIEPSAD